MHENTTVLATFVQLISAPWKEYISDISVGVKVIREITYASDYGIQESVTISPLVLVSFPSAFAYGPVHGSFGKVW